MSSKLNFKPVTDISQSHQPAKKVVYSVKNNGRELDENEKEAEEKAEKFSIKYYKRITPVPGTLAFMYRNLEGGNPAVIEHLRNAIKTNNARFARNFITLWDNMDEFSKKRIDIFDILCEKFSVPRKKFWGVVQEGMFDFQEQITQTALGQYKLELVELMKKMAQAPRNVQDRRILAEATGVIKKEPLVKFEDNSKNLTVNNQSPIPSFSKSISNAENNVRDITPSRQMKELPPSTQEFIEGELIDEENQARRELQFIKRIEDTTDIEISLEQAAKEL